MSSGQRSRQGTERQSWPNLPIGMESVASYMAHVERAGGQCEFVKHPPANRPHERPKRCEHSFFSQRLFLSVGDELLCEDHFKADAAVRRKAAKG